MVVKSRAPLINKPYFADLFGLYCLKQMAPQYGYKVSSTDSTSEGYVHLALLTLINRNSSLIEANLSVFQCSVLDPLSSEVMKQLMNLKRLCDIVTENNSFELS